MILVYSICYYYGKNKKSNITNHINAFNDLQAKNKIFFLCVMSDDVSEIKCNKIRKDLEPLLENVNHNILISYNWGGTVVALWETYLFLKNKVLDKIPKKHT